MDEWNLMTSNQKLKSEIIDYKARYDLIEQHWAYARTVLPKKDQELFNAFFDLLPAKSTVLDIGCGSGIPIAKQISDRGFHVHGVDRSEKLLAQAKRNVPNASFERAEIEELDLQEFSRNLPLGGIVCWDALFHIPRDLQAKALERMSKAMEANSPIIISSGGTETNIPAFTDTMFGIEFYYDSFPISELIALCESFGLFLATSSLVNTPDGKRDKGRIGFIFIKQAQP
jgi:2-polyprenyl-3-methyl-5-hydroxy-6-metoxy-1,4-benzoquinol methylase